MMENKMLDDYLEAYKRRTDHGPSQELRDKILAAPAVQRDEKPSGLGNIFNLMMPKAVGWALTCILGVYLGSWSALQENEPEGEEYYLFAQAQILLSENLTSEEFEE